MTNNLLATLAYVSVDAIRCNTMTLSFLIAPKIYLNKYYTPNTTNLITSSDSRLTYMPSSTAFDGTYINATFIFSKNIEQTTVTFTFNPKYFFPSSPYLTQTTSTSFNASIISQTNIPATYSDSNMCGLRSSTPVYHTAQTSVGYAGLLISLISCKIIGL